MIAVAAQGRIAKSHPDCPQRVGRPFWIPPQGWAFWTDKQPVQYFTTQEMETYLPKLMAEFNRVAAERLAKAMEDATPCP
jgi:hypothetical protein